LYYQKYGEGLRDGAGPGGLVLGLGDSWYLSLRIQILGQGGGLERSRGCLHKVRTKQVLHVRDHREHLSSFPVHLSVPGLILPNGDINWNCPCLGGMASGPCGEQFKSAFSCFHYSTEDIKGSDCIDQFRAMQECMQKYPDLYPQDEEEEEEAKPVEPVEETADTKVSAAKEQGTSS
jgi:intermembrane space import and assembly protein 40